MVDKVKISWLMWVLRKVRCFSCCSQAVVLTFLFGQMGKLGLEERKWK